MRVRSTQRLLAGELASERFATAHSMVAASRTRVPARRASTRIGGCGSTRVATPMRGSRPCALPHAPRSQRTTSPW